MIKKRKTSNYGFIPKKKQINLDNQDTSETSNDKSSSATQNIEYEKIVNVPPPFKGEQSNKAVTWSEASYIYKVAIIIGSFFLTIVVPSIWFVSKMDSKVENIENDVREIKQITKDLTKTSIKNSSKIDGIEKLLDEYKKNMASPNLD